MEEKINFEEAFLELTQIAKEIEEQSVPVDVLAERVQRASVLIALCQTRLRNTEDIVGKIIDQMNQSSTL